MNEYNDLLEKISEYEEIAILPDTIAIGKVIKIRVCGNIDENEEEYGYLYLPKASGIKEHFHTKDFETYTLVKGVLSIHGKKVSHDLCEIGKSHCIDPVSEDTIIRYHKSKIKKKVIQDTKNIKKA